MCVETMDQSHVEEKWNQHEPTSIMDSDVALLSLLLAHLYWLKPCKLTCRTSNVQARATQDRLCTLLRHTEHPTLLHIGLRFASLARKENLEAESLVF